MRGRREGCVRARSLIVLLAVTVACEARPAEAPGGGVQGGPPSATSWRTLGNWSGTGDRQTGSFDVTTGALRLAWEARADETEGRLRITLHSAISGRPLETVVDSRGSAADTAHVALEPRVAYLRIEAVGLEWHLTLDEGVTRSVQGEPHP